jgi:sugar phosphate isomerase/epimerase
MGFKYSVITGTMGEIGDRFLTGGYKGDNTFEDKLKSISKMGIVDGLELCYNIDGDESDPEIIKPLMKKYKFEASVVNSPLFGDKKWKFGSFTSKEKSVRKDAVDIAKKTLDFAEKVGAEGINLWLGQDGFDYPFQADYSKQWEFMIECTRECADYKPGQKITLEFKPREPRNRAQLDSAGTTMLMIRDIDRKNVGVTLDVGHVLQSQQNMASSVELISRYGKLFNLHMNDNYAAWDDDMIVGSVHMVEFIELFFVLRKVKFDGWLSVDIFPYREDAFRATEESILYMKKFDQLVDVIGFKELEKCLEGSDPTEVVKLIRNRIFK